MTPEPIRIYPDTPPVHRYKRTDSVDDRLAGLTFHEPNSGCHLFTGYIAPTGYGQIQFHGQKWWVHRLAYTALVGPIPPGLTIDHLCRNRVCINPAHLEVVTNVENSMRGNGPPAQNARKTECPKGHPYDCPNTYVDRDGHRFCRACNRIRARIHAQLYGCRP